MKKQIKSLFSIAFFPALFSLALLAPTFVGAAGDLPSSDLAAHARKAHKDRVAQSERLEAKWAIIRAQNAIPLDQKRLRKGIHTEEGQEWATTIAQWAMLEDQKNLRQGIHTEEWQEWEELRCQHAKELDPHLIVALFNKAFNLNSAPMVNDLASSLLAKRSDKINILKIAVESGSSNTFNLVFSKLEAEAYALQEYQKVDILKSTAETGSPEMFDLVFSKLNVKVKNLREHEKSGILTAAVQSGPPDLFDSITSKLDCQFSTFQRCSKRQILTPAIQSGSTEKFDLVASKLELKYNYSDETPKILAVAVEVGSCSMVKHIAELARFDLNYFLAKWREDFDILIAAMKNPSPEMLNYIAPMVCDPYVEYLGNLEKLKILQSAAKSTSPEHFDKVTSMLEVKLCTLKDQEKREILKSAIQNSTPKMLDHVSEMVKLDSNDITNYPILKSVASKVNSDAPSEVARRGFWDRISLALDMFCSQHPSF